eukprot:1144163-Pelagomonas_calceolata.AAC.5
MLPPLSFLQGLWPQWQPLRQALASLQKRTFTWTDAASSLAQKKERNKRKKRKKERKNYAVQVWPCALRKAHLS